MLADNFSGLPGNMSHLELCDALDTARVALDLSSDELWYLLFLIRRTRRHDWVKGAEPIVAWPKFEICVRTGWSEDKLSRIERSLAEKRLIAFRDSINCKRFAYRDQNGMIQKDACGISLAPAGARASEIAAAAHEHVANCKKISAVFDQLFEVKRQIASLKGAGDLPEAARAEANEIYDRLPRRKDHAAVLAQLTKLRDGALRVIKLLRQILGLPCSRPYGRVLLEAPAASLSEA